MHRYLIPALVLSFAGGSAVAQEGNAGFTPIADCIVSNAPAVERAVSDLSDAAKFLTGGVCADAVAAREAAQRQAQYEKYRAAQQKRCEALKSVQGATGEMDEDSEETDYAYMCGDEDLFEGATVALFSASAPVYKPPADALALASKTLLELRIARLDGTAEGKQ